MRATGLLFLCCLVRLVQYAFMEEKCAMTIEKTGYDFVVGKVLILLVLNKRFLFVLLGL